MPPEAGAKSMSADDPLISEPEEHRPFLRAIFAEPKDTMRMRMFADYLDDQRLEADASFWRWIADTGNWPGHLNWWCLTPNCCKGDGSNT
jgi:uncharacterized protein (TIGR02996 family)